MATNYFTLIEHARFAAEKMAKVPLAETPRLLCDLYCLEPGQAQKTHSHSDIDKIYVVLHGAAQVTIGEEARTLAPGQAAFAPAGVPHGVRNHGEGRATLLVFQAREPKHEEG